MDLKYSDTQQFWKDLRYRNSLVSDEKIKYFLAGEYGEKTYRPHYHAIVYNIKDVNDIEKTWDKGQIHVGKVQEASIYYTLKYALKSAGKIKKSDPWDDRTIEKALMSKGLGVSYLTDEMVKYHKEDVERGVTMLGNKKLPLPRYYRDKIFTQKEKQLRNFKMQDLNESRFDTTADKLFPQRVKKMYDDQEKKQKKTD